MVDSADHERIDEARHELHRIIADKEMRHAVVLVFANKQDLDDGMHELHMGQKDSLPFCPLCCLSLSPLDQAC